MMLEAAIEDVERFLHRQLMTATWRLYLDRFPRMIRLAHSPVSSISQIEYLDADGVLQTLASSVYQSDLVSEPARIMQAEGQNWPDVQSGTFHVVRVTYVAGYTNRFLIPTAIRMAIIHHAGDLYEHRESQIDISGSLRDIRENVTTSRLLSKYQIPFVV